MAGLFANFRPLAFCFLADTGCIYESLPLPAGLVDDFLSLLTGLATQDGYDGTDTLINIEVVAGSTFGDTLIGGGQAARQSGSGTFGA